MQNKKNHLKPTLNNSLSHKVTIYIWHSDETRWGHVAMRTYIGGYKNEGHYISFWPGANSIDKELKDTHFWQADKEKKKSFEDAGGKNARFFGYLRDMEMEKSIDGMLLTDCKAENGDPNMIVDLFSLDVKKINNDYERFKSSGCKWAIYGSSFFKTQDTQNCCGLCLFLLNAGGITNLAKYNDFYLAKIISLLGSTFGFFAVPIILNATGNAASTYSSRDQTIWETIVAMLPGLISEPALAQFFAISMTLYGALGGIFGGLFGAGLDTWKGIKYIITPNGVSALTQMAQQNEREKFHIKDNQVSENKHFMDNNFLRSKL